MPYRERVGGGGGGLIDRRLPSEYDRCPVKQADT